MVPSAYLTFFTTSASAAGALIGLLFIAVTMRADSIVGPSAPVTGRALAGSSFTGLANAFLISLMAAIPTVELGDVAVVLATVSLFNTARLHLRLRSEETRWSLLVLSTAAYVSQLGLGIDLVVHHRSTWAVNDLCYVVIASFVAALGRAWSLIQGRHLADAKTAQPS